MVDSSMDSGGINLSRQASERPVILQVLPRLVTGGVERGTVDMAAALSKVGWVTLVASEGGPMVRDLERVGATHITLPLASKNPWRIRQNVRALRAVARDYHVSLIHARSRAPAWAALRAARSENIPFVTTFHGTYGVGPLGVKKAYNRVMTLGDRVIAISHFIRRHILGHYMEDDASIRVIHRGVDLNRFDPQRVSAERMIQLSRKWQLPDGDPVILLPGRLTRWKGHLLLVEALSRLKHRRFRCVMVGSDQGRSSFRRTLSRAIAHAGLEDRVLLAGECDDMPSAYMVSDVVVSASSDPEAFGRICAEGQAMGCPIIAPDHGAAPEIVEPGQTGWLFAPNNIDTLTSLLTQCLDLRPEQREDLSRKAVLRAQSLFSAETMCQKTMDVYKELLPHHA